MNSYEYSNKPWRVHHAPWPTSLDLPDTVFPTHIIGVHTCLQVCACFTSGEASLVRCGSSSIFVNGVFASAHNKQASQCMCAVCNPYVVCVCMYMSVCMYTLTFKVCGPKLWRYLACDCATCAFCLWHWHTSLPNIQFLELLCLHDTFGFITSDWLFLL